MPSNPTLHKRKLGTLRYTAGGRETLEIDKNGVLLRLFLRLRFTVTNGATGPVGPLFQTLARLISRMEITAAGKDTVQTVPGYFLASRAYLENGMPAPGMTATVVLTNSAVTSYDVTLPVEFTLPLGAREDDCALDTTGLSQLSMVITWGTITDLFATPNGATISNASLDVEGWYNATPLRDSNGMAVSGRTGKPYLVRQLDFTEAPVTASSSAYSMVMDGRTGLTVLSLQMVALADNVGVDTVINNFNLSAASWVYALRDAAMIRAENIMDLRLVSGSTQPGVHYIEPRLNGSVMNAIYTGELAGDLKATMDVTLQGAVCKIAVQRESIRNLIR